MNTSGLYFNRHSFSKPSLTFMSSASWFPLLIWTAWGYNSLKQKIVITHSMECCPLSTISPLKTYLAESQVHEGKIGDNRTLIKSSWLYSGKTAYAHTYINTQIHNHTMSTVILPVAIARRAVEGEDGQKIFQLPMNIPYNRQTIIPFDGDLNHIVKRC